MSVPAEVVEARARFDTFFEEERERLFQACTSSPVTAMTRRS